MPSATLKSLAKKADVSVDRAEHLWDEAKDIVSKEYKYGKKDHRYWALVTGIVKKMMGLKKKATFKEMLNAPDDEDLHEEVTAQDKKRQELYARWKELINMSGASVEAYKKSQTEKGRKDPKKYPGLKPAHAASLGISSGVQSASWIVKMKKTPVKDWTPEMWKWAGKQVSFVSRMKGNDGPLKDEDGNDTRKTISLKIWGHNPNH